MELIITLLVLHLATAYSQLPIVINPLLARAPAGVTNPYLANPIARQVSTSTCNVAGFIMQPAFDIRRFMGAW